MLGWHLTSVSRSTRNARRDGQSERARAPGTCHGCRERRGQLHRSARPWALMTLLRNIGGRRAEPNLDWQHVNVRPRPSGGSAEGAGVERAVRVLWVLRHADEASCRQLLARRAAPWTLSCPTSCPHPSRTSRPKSTCTSSCTSIYRRWCAA